MTIRDSVSDMELNAYLDGELPAEERLAIEAWLASHPEDAARLEQLRRVGELIKDRYGAIAEEPVPAALTAAFLRGRDAGAGVRMWLQLAAAIVLLLAGGVAGYGLRGITAEEQVAQEAQVAFVDEALGAHTIYASEVRHPVEVAASEEDHLVKWLTKRIGADVRAPSLAAQHFRLMGGRLLAAVSDPAAQFMYEDDRGRRLTLYVRQAGPLENTAFQFADHDGLSAFYWIDKPLAYAIIAELPREELLTVTRAVYEQLE